jgi:hypothetical protein
LWTDNPEAQRRNLLADAITHFEIRKPRNILTILARATAPYELRPITHQHQRYLGQLYAYIS